jgi:hypothetical protein
MSLINDALKKAQRSRSAESGDLAPLPGGGARITKRGVPLSAKAILLMATGAFVLFVLAVVGTVYLLNRPSASPSVAVAKAPTAATTPGSEAPVIVVPVITAPPAKATSPESSTPSAPTPAPTTPAPTPPAKADPPPATAKAAPSPVTPATAAPAPNPPAAAPATPAAPDERVHSFLDNLHVTAVRLQGNDSRVMIGERVFRLNDIVERSLGIRLSKVEQNQIIFTDANGVAYVKYF